MSKSESMRLTLKTTLIGDTDLGGSQNGDCSYQMWTAKEALSLLESQHRDPAEVCVSSLLLMLLSSNIGIERQVSTVEIRRRVEDMLAKLMPQLSNINIQDSNCERDATQTFEHF